MRLSQDRAHELLREMFDPEDRWWWTAGGLLALTTLARRAAGRAEKFPDAYADFSGGELRYWLEVYRRLRMLASAARAAGALDPSRASRETRSGLAP